ARPFAGRMAQMAEEVDRMTSRASIPDKATLLAVLEVRQMPFAGKAHQPASDNPATDHRAGIVRDRAGSLAGTRSTFCGHGSESPQMGPPSRQALPCGFASDLMASVRTRSRFAPSAPGTCWPR